MERGERLQHYLRTIQIDALAQVINTILVSLVSQCTDEQFNIAINVAENIMMASLECPESTEAQNDKAYREYLEGDDLEPSDDDVVDITPRGRRCLEKHLQEKEKTDA